MQQSVCSISGKALTPSRDNRKGNLPNINDLKSVKIVEVETLFLGGGPATLGMLSNAY